MSDWRGRLRPFADHIEAIYELVVNASDEDLMLFLEDVKHPTETNCGWSTYQAAKMIREEIISEIARRKSKRARAVRS